MPALNETCIEYENYAAAFHPPASLGPLQLPFQRPIQACRTFTSAVINQVVDTVSSKMKNLDLARLFTNAFPNTLDTTISQTACITAHSLKCLPLSFIITGDIDAMWLRDSANQVMPYMDYLNQDISLKRLVLGTIYMQAHFISIDPYANAFRPPSDIAQWALQHQPPMNEHMFHSPGSLPQVFEYKWEIDSLASFISLSYQYWQTTSDSSFIESPLWLNAVETILDTVEKEQQPTFDPKNGKPPHSQHQFLNGRGQPIKYTGMVRSLFRPSDDACVFTFYVPGNAMLSVELAHLSQMISSTNGVMAAKAKKISDAIRTGIYQYAVVDVPNYGKVFAFEVDGYGSQLIMDDANVPSLMSLPIHGFVSQDDPIYQNTRKLVLSRDNPYYFEGPFMAGVGGPHIGLNYAWPMSQIVRLMTSDSDEEIQGALEWILNSTSGTGLIHESVNIYVDEGNSRYTRSWFAWANGLFGQAILKLAKERPHLIFSN
ncbi:hypothetical protein DM01DRAFT_1364697 [Hesseltinella vesiculosa]|uniref:DUF1237-domain-containing protein n=1 Tax=Hesseltinella vesiculosa TaxID=101127 RepID=A0A1X2G4S3_9FUNG|nr:hypothetical protein DM01DRAFT_1364697 [Hesseltinella vesiculosa]